MEFSVAALLATLCAISLKIAPRFLQRCDIRGIYVAVLCGAFMPACALVSIFLWTRAAFLAVARREEIRATTVELTILRREERVGVPNEPTEPLDSQQSGCAVPAKRCRTKRCLFAVILVVMVCTLTGVWHEFGQYEVFASELDFRWGFLQTASKEDVPVWLGEFGTNAQSLWWKHVLRYIAEHDLDFAYWSVNGEKYNGISETLGKNKYTFILFNSL